MRLLIASTLAALPTTFLTADLTQAVPADASVAAAATPRCEGKKATIVGTPGDDRIKGTPGLDVIVGEDGDDFIRGGGGDDIICGGPGDDVLWSQGGKDRVFGDSGQDSIDGGDGKDRLDGGVGKDRFPEGIKGPDFVLGGPGNDSIVLGSGTEGASALVYGGAGNDRFAGRPANRSIHGGPGRDALQTGAGPTQAPATLTVDYRENLVSSDQSEDMMRVTSIEVTRVYAFEDLDAEVVFYGTSGDDLVVIHLSDGGGLLPLTAYGYAGDDEMIGSGEDDYFSGGSGADTAHGHRDRAETVSIEKFIEFGRPGQP